MPIDHISHLSSRTDRALVARVRAGEQQAFALIHGRYRRLLTEYAAHLLGPRRQEAEDVVQDAFLRAYRSLTTSDREVELRPWLYRIVHNRAVDELRRPVRTTPLDSPERVGSVPNAATESDAREELAAVVADVIALPARQRQAFVGQAIDGLPHHEMARRLGTTTAGSKMLVSRARGSLLAARDLRLAA